MRERIVARLELCRATLAAFAATIMKLHVADEEQAAVATGSVTDHLDTVAEKLEILETVLGVEPEIVTALPPASAPSSAPEPPAASATAAATAASSASATPPAT
jgi:hypothetical protein